MRNENGKWREKNTGLKKSENFFRENNFLGLNFYKKLSMHISRNINTAFTLLELLIVIAIIATLAGLLLPALQGAKEISRRIVCIGNFKQLGASFSLYVQDVQEGYYPPYYYGPVGNRYFATSCLVKNEYAKGTSFLCPSLKRTSSRIAREIFWKTGTESASINNVNWPYPDYGYNYKYIGTAAPAQPARISQIIRPSSTVLLADVALNTNTDEWITDTGYIQLEGKFETGTTRAFLYPRHSGSGNILWIDGHASSERMGFGPAAYENNIFSDHTEGSSGNIWDRF